MSESTGLCGHFHLACAVRPDGTSYVSQQDFAAPFHLSKTYWDGGVLLVNVINPTAGLFGGDLLGLRVKVEPGARVLLSSPSAARFHPSAGRDVELEQHFEVKSGAFLDVYPEIAIPQRDSRAQQRTTIEIEPGGELLYLETLAPGRVASGETFAFAKYAWSTDVRLGGTLILRERASLTQDSSLAGLRAFSPSGYYGGLLIVSPASEAWNDDFAREIGDAGKTAGVIAGASRLPAGGWSWRVLANDALLLRKAIDGVRRLVYRRLGRALPDARRS